MFIVYGGEKCSYCTKAKMLLDMREKDYQYFDIYDQCNGAEDGCDDCSQARHRHHDLRADIGFRFQQDRVHVGMRLDPAGQCLQCLRAADLAAVHRHGGVVRHVLRLEGAHGQPTPDGRPAEAGNKQGFSDVRSGSLEHQRMCQNSIPA